MYMCIYMFIWAECASTVEMDLTFVLVVRFISFNLNGVIRPQRRFNRSLYAEGEECAAVLNDMNVLGEGNRKTGPLEIEKSLDFAS